MIVLNVFFRCRAGMRDAFLEALMTEGIDEACRSEDGNIKYDFYLPSISCSSEGADDAVEELLLVEKWKDIEALEFHRVQPHFLRIGELKDDYVADTIIEKF